MIYVKKKYTIKYELEENPEIDLSPRSVNNIIENLNSSFKFFKYFFSISCIMAFFYFIIIGIAFYLFEYNGLKISASILFTLHIILFFKIYLRFYQIQIKEGLQNNGYITLNIILTSVIKLISQISSFKAFPKKTRMLKTRGYLERFPEKKQIKQVIQIVEFILNIPQFLIISIFDLFRTVVFIFLYIIIPSFLAVNSLTGLLLYESIIILYYGTKFISLHRVIVSMMEKPKFVTLHALDGTITENLILYKTTSVDYRFKNYVEGDEVIFPFSSVKKISQCYIFELKELDKVINEEFLPLCDTINNQHGKIIVASLLFTNVRNNLYHLWYRKAKIYMKMGEQDKTKIALTNAVKASKNSTFRSRKNENVHSAFIDTLMHDDELINIRKENWFTDLLK
ncbi:hypothetical protein [Methanosarcina sp. MTP4]|uniref:hypothetical protein n=1 Tax=Methanosarcina sp. MTP4 TaxID=1434100 RepID=UPI0018CC907C|nr:hypothetical protein [Methanosarcina sp. MTP4]